MTKLGQHFLKSKQVVRDIITTANVSAKDTVLEIGAGKGALTEALLEHAGKVIAVEKDAELVEYLQKKFADEITNGKLVLLSEDVRNFQLSTFNFPTRAYKLVANIPYYITGQLLRQFLTATHKPEHIVFLVQKEVAHRIVARDGKESLLSISVKAFGTPKYIKKVPARHFSPAPDVDSAILSVTDIRSPFETPQEEEQFFDTLHRGFAHKRKLLKSNLGCSEEVLARCNIEANARAEDMTYNQWVCLSTSLAQLST